MHPGMRFSRVGAAGVVTRGLVEYWKGNNSSFFSDLAGTTPQTTNGGNVLCWTGSRNAIKMINNIGSFRPVLMLDSVGSGVSGINLNSALIVQATAAASLNFQSCSAVALVRRQTTDKISIANLTTIAGDFAGVANFYLNDGWQRPSLGSTGSYKPANIGYDRNIWTVIGITSSATEVSFCVNGQLSDANAESVVSTAGVAFALGTFSGNLSTGAIAAFAGYSVTLSRSELQQMVQAVMADHGITEIAVAPDLCVLGNSIVQGSSSLFDPYWSSAAESLNISLRSVKAYGRSGQTTAQLLAEAPTTLAAAYVLGSTNILVIDEITNSAASNVPAATWLSELAQLVTVARGLNYQVVTCTAMDRNAFFSNGQNAVGFRANIATGNAAVVANVGSAYADFVADRYADPDLGLPGAADNTTYFIDKLHPTQAGHTKISPIVKTQIQNCLT